MVYDAANRLVEAMHPDDVPGNATDNLAGTERVQRRGPSSRHRDYAQVIEEQTGSNLERLYTYGEIFNSTTSELGT